MEELVDVPGLVQHGPLAAFDVSEARAEPIGFVPYVGTRFPFVHDHRLARLQVTVEIVGERLPRELEVDRVLPDEHRDRLKEVEDVVYNRSRLSPPSSTCPEAAAVPWLDEMEGAGYLTSATALGQ
jgi:hypothetical protein